MNKEDVQKFFEYLGEIRRDITLIEFLMRCSIAKIDKDIEKFPKPPYKKGKIYKDPPKSFLHFSFEIIVEKFNKRHPATPIGKDLVELRNAMAHGVIAEINNSNVNQLVKFKEIEKTKEVEVEFSATLGLEELKKYRDFAYATKVLLMKLASD